MERPEPTPNIVTWVYEDGSFVPSAKLVNDERFSIVSDYMGRPVQAFDDTGQVVWQADYDIYGGLRNLKGEREFIPFRQLGQYEDQETGVYYNRFRYYEPETGGYLSQDPIGLAGGNPTLYGYVFDTNIGLDIFGLLTIKLGGYVVQVHAEDVDPWPSIPHGHIYDKGFVVDSEGVIYKAHKGKAVGKFSKKDKSAWKEF